MAQLTNLPLFLCSLLVFIIVPKPLYSINIPSSLGFTANVVPLTCDDESLNKCLAPVAKIAQEPSLSYPTNDFELDSTCRLWAKVDKCSSKYMKHCAKHEINSMFGEIVNGSKSVFDKICQPGKGRQDYLNFASCFRNFSFAHCNRGLEKFHNFSTVVNKSTINSQARLAGKIGERFTRSVNGPTDKQLKDFCCAYQHSILCQERVIQEKCGIDAIIYFNLHLKRMSTTVLTDHCETFVTNEKCHEHVFEIDKVKNAKNGSISQNTPGENRSNWISTSRGSIYINPRGLEHLFDYRSGCRKISKATVLATMMLLIAKIFI